MSRFIVLGMVTSVLLGCEPQGSAPTGSSQSLLSKTEISERYAAKLREALPNATVKSESGGVSVRDAELDYTWHSDNAYREYRRWPETLDEILDRHVATALEQKSSGYVFNIETVLACVRAEIEFPPSDDPRERLAYTLIAGDLRQYYCGDSENGIAILNEAELADLRQADSLFDEKIVSNIPKLSGTLNYNPTSTMTLVTSGGNYESSLILVPGVWETLKDRHGDDLAFVVPARDLLLVAAITDSDGIAQMRSSAQEFYDKSSYAISPLVYRYHKGEISVLSQ